MNDLMETRSQVVAMLLQGGGYNHKTDALLKDAQKIIDYIENGICKHTSIIGKPKFTHEEAVESREEL